MLTLARRRLGKPLGVSDALAALSTATGLVFVVALLNGLAWSLLTPPFQVPDETAHFAYVQSIAENGTPAGRPGRPEASTEQAEAMAAMGTLGIIGRAYVHPPRDGEGADRALHEAADTAARNDGGGASSASGQPPLYYAVAAVAYRAFGWATLPTRLQAMRAVSVFIFAIGAAVCASLAGSVLPSCRWAPMVGGLAVALSPYAAFIGSGVTPDTLLLTVSAALALTLVRAFDSGLTRKRAVALGLVLGAGAMTKLIFLAFIPPMVPIVLYLAVRASAGNRQRVRGVLQLIVITVGAAALLPLSVFLWTTLTGDTASTSTQQVNQSLGVDQATNLKLVAVYAWELFLPRLPFMSHQFSYSPPLATWVDGFAGRYGWLDYSATPSVIEVFRWTMAMVAIGAGISMIRARRAIAARRFEVLAYGSLLVALALVIAKTGYDYRVRTGYVFEQPRYLFGLTA